MPLELCGHASGLFCLRRMSKEVRDEKAEYTEHVICNPSTVQYGFLPRVRTGIQAVYVFYFHPGRNTVKRLEVQGLEHRGGSRVYAFVDHVDDLTFNMNSWQLHQDVPPRFESFNKFRALSLLDDV
ncbi:unnamed protein product [Brassica oleracea]|uniref:(rape) hypothetical protein n=1 Tax=Brassica napus TaxID=3708 RepID=A0A816UE81_BRANA|nr:unnamed protein product [Brassica napus]